MLEGEALNILNFAIYIWAKTYFVPFSSYAPAQNFAKRSGLYYSEATQLK